LTIAPNQIAEDKKGHRNSVVKSVFRK
jgi:hypothetical protein